MKKVIFYSVLLLIGLAGSQVFPLANPEAWSAGQPLLKWLTLFCLAFIMIHVGHEFDIDKRNLKMYGWDYVVAATAAAFPWIFSCLYFVFVLNPSTQWGSWDTWKEMLLASRFAAPTSAGILFTMLAAAGLASTWVFKKARILAIFDDLDTVLLMIPLKMLMVGFRWQLGLIVVLMAIQIWILWRYLHRFAWPVGWRWVGLYAAIIASVCEGIYLISRAFNESVPIHMEVLLPAFVLGGMIAHRTGADGHSNSDEKASNVISGAFMLLVGLSMPMIFSGNVGAGPQGMSWGLLIGHVLAVTALSNIGKMFPLLCYRNESTWRERLALCVTMFPRGEVGAGVLVVSLSYGIGGAAVTVALLSLALNLMATGLIIWAVRKLLAHTPGTVVSGTK